MGEEVTLRLEGLGIDRNGCRVVGGINLAAARGQALCLVGAAGVGKSSLLAAIAGDPCRSLRVHGRIRAGGVSLEALQERCVEVPQKLLLPNWGDCGTSFAALAGQGSAATRSWPGRPGVEADGRPDMPVLDAPPKLRRALAVLALLRRDAPLYLVDEPTAGIDDFYALLIRRRLAAIARSALLVMATHNRQDCLAVPGHTALLAAGTLKEAERTEVFFDTPQTACGRLYVQTGTCHSPPLETGPIGEGIWCLVPGRLYGMSRPGLVAPADSQFARLRACGVSVLVCAEERPATPVPEVVAAGFSHLHIPIEDMQPPTLRAMADLCRRLDAPAAAAAGGAVHCRGGLGRTGTVLAALRVWQGKAPDAAVHQVRNACPHAIQNEGQLRFVHAFARHIADWPKADPSPAQQEYTHVAR